MIKIMTYNLSWEMMTASDRGGFDATFCNSNGVNKCKENAIKLISQENPDILALQEYPESILGDLEVKKNREYAEITTKSASEMMITIYDKKKFNLEKNVIYDEFISGRPYIIIALKHKKSGKTIIVANIHCGHAKNASEDCILKKNFLDSLATFITKNVEHIVILGDNNRDYSRQYNVILPIERLLGIKFYLDTETTATCCYKFDVNGKILRVPFSKYDWMLYNRGSIKTKIPLVDSEISDHRPLVGFIEI